MYHMKPYNDVVKIEETDIMYNVSAIQNKPVHLNAQKEVPVELLQLKQRQDQLLQLLDRLNNELSELSSNPCNTKDEFMSSPLDIVIQINPNKPMTSLKYFHALLKQKFRLLWKTHQHSSLRHSLAPYLYNVNETCLDRSHYGLIVSVVYTADVNEPVAILEPSSAVSVVGESDIARIVGRLMGEYEGPCVELTATCDICLDACTILSSSVSCAKEKQIALHTLDQVLQRRKFLCGDSYGYVDAVVESVLLRSGVNIQSKSLRTWLNK